MKKKGVLFYRKYQFTLILLGISLLCYGVFTKQLMITEQKMGTTITIKAYFRGIKFSYFIKKDIQKLLTQLTNSMSTYEPLSEISQFNHIQKLVPIQISPYFYDVLTMSKKIVRLSNGAWDPTIKPLVDIWGFSEQSNILKPPSKYKIRKAKQQIGFTKIIFLKQNQIKKRNPTIQLDVSSIAKGYAVDKIAELLKKKGFFSAYIDIGGEIVVFGPNRKNEPWKIGINQPKKQAALNDIYAVLSVQDKAIATSGDYRQYFHYNGQDYSHIIDPRTGFPTTNHVVSVTVVANSCAFADGLATAIMVLGVKKGLALVNSLDHVEALIIKQQKNKQLTPFYSENMDQYVLSL